MWVGHIARMGEMKSAYKILVRKTGGKLSIWRPRLWNEDNIKIDLKEIRCEDVDWIQVGQGNMQWRALVNTAMKIRVP
jgi:hypothetical protein